MEVRKAEMLTGAPTGRRGGGSRASDGAASASGRFNAEPASKCRVAHMEAGKGCAVAALDTSVADATIYHPAILGAVLTLSKYTHWQCPWG